MRPRVQNLNPNVVVKSSTGWIEDLNLQVLAEFQIVCVFRATPVQLVCWMFMVGGIRYHVQRQKHFILGCAIDGILFICV
jgi:hypothetical protein